jgi:hypothetical protein
MCREERGRIYIGDRKRVWDKSSILAMVKDEKDNSAFHVLTAHPLEVHSYYAVLR